MNEKQGNPLTRRQFLKAAAITTGAITTGSLLEACGAPQASPPPATPTSPPATPVPAAKPTMAPTAAPAKAAELKIGVALPYSGVFAREAESIASGLMLYFESVGMKAGGRDIKIIREDTEAKPDVGLRKIRKLVEQDNVDLLTGIVSSAVGLAVRDYVDQNKAILVIANAGANDLTRARKSKYIVRASFSNWQLNYPMGDWIYENLGKEAFISGSDFAAGREQVGAFVESFTKAGGKIIGEVWPPLSTTDYGPYLAKIASANPPISYSFFAGEDAVRFVKQFVEFGLKSKIKLCGTGGLLDEDTFPGQGLAGVGGYSGFHYVPSLDNAENKKFLADYKAKYNKTPDSYSVQGYDAARLIVDSINKVQGNTSNKEKLLQEMVNTKFKSPRGDFSIDPETQNVISDIHIREVKNIDGKPTNVILKTVKAVRDPGK